jgi:serine/threonine-protein kinase
MSDSELLHDEPLAQDYELAASLSRGNHFSVFLAYHRRSGQSVALKILRAAPAADDQLVQQVHQQFELVSSLKHRNLIPIHEVGLTSSGQPFATMPYLEGGTLAQWTQAARRQANPPSAWQILKLARHIALGAATLHQARIVHPELMPDNILMNRGSTPVLVGLGLPATSHDPIAEQSSVGLAQYRAPEVRSGQAPDTRSNIYSLGIMLYELLNVDAPEDHRWPGGMAPPLPLEEVRNDLSPETAAVVNQCLRREAGERYQSMESVIAGLDQAIAAESAGPIASLAESWRLSSSRAWLTGRKRTLLALVSALVMLIVCMALILLRPEGRGPDELPGQSTRVAPVTSVPIEQPMPTPEDGQIELLGPADNALIAPGDETAVRWCWSEQPLEQARFAIFIMSQGDERRLEIPIEQVDTFCYQTILAGAELATEPDQLAWQIRVIDGSDERVITRSEWRTLIVEVVTTPTATATLVPSDTPTNTPTATPSPTPTETPTVTPTQTATPRPTATVTLPPSPTPTSVPTSPPPVATSPPPTATSVPPTATSPPPTATPP